jgi:glycosyltransferase involved in cell wall biosynthesis
VEMISLLLPSRKRSEVLRRMVKSVRDTATNEVEIVVRFDDDDLASADESPKEVIALVGPRIRNITQCWNECFDMCRGDIVAQANDDIVFTTPGWDVMVEKAFAEVPDKILLVHGDDIFGHRGNFGPHPFVHRRWVEALGYFIPPYFCSDFGDAWPNELADRIGRRRFVPFTIEHRHFSHGFPEMEDETTKDRLSRHAEDDPDSIYYSQEKMAERARDAQKLAALMDSAVDTHGWTPPKERSGILSMGKCPKCGSVSTVPGANGKVHCNQDGHEWDRVKK